MPNDDGIQLYAQNPRYWRRSETMLRLTHERDIIVQIVRQAEGTDE